VQVTNPDRVVFPREGITKGEVFEYYRLVSAHILTFVAGRALTVERYPKGIGDQGFMQKNAPDHYPEFIERHETPKEGGGTTVYPVVNTVEGIEFFANLGVITFHVPPVLASDVMHPDWVIWDLDPPPDRVDLVRRAALSLKEILESLGIITQPMTSGSKGYHLRARVVPNLGVEEAAGLARGVAALAIESDPQLFTLAFRKKERGERVFVDWMRNAPYSTAVAPWSLRPRDGAPVAAPVTWKELETTDPDAIRMGDVGRRLGEDPWVDSLDVSTAVNDVADAIASAGIVLEPFDRFRS
jgi:bifunctional non-homologous end joining protein LigD